MKKLLLILLCIPFIGFGQNLAIGDTYQGGEIFYLDGNGGGLIGGPLLFHDPPNNTQNLFAIWGCSGTLISGANGTAIGTGAQNTNDIINGCASSSTGAYICDTLTIGGYNDWFLPSKDELNEIYLNNTIWNAGPGGGGQYISSSQYDYYSNYHLQMSNGSWWGGGKDVPCLFRPVRAISTITGCMESTAFNYNPTANFDDGSCESIVLGCIDITTFNYDALANTDDGSCIAVALGCIDSTSYNYNPNANIDDGSCLYCSYMDNDYISDLYSTNVSCNGGNDGSIYGIDLTSAILNNGNGPYTYSIDSGLTFQSSTTFSNLTIGNYYITYMDANGCINPNTSNYWIEIIEPDAYQYTVNMDTVSCQGINDGSITLSISGNTPAYSVNWDNGMQGTNLNSLVDGMYTAYISDVNGCLDTFAIDLLSHGVCGCVDPTAYNYDPLATVYDISCLYCDYFSNSLPFYDGTAQDVTCNGGSDGNITNLAIDPTLYLTGYPPFQFSIDAGNSFLDTNSFYNLAAGSYYFTFMDANGCIHPDTLAAWWEVAEPDAFVYNVAESDVSCSGGNDGSIALNVVSGNTSPYSIDWSNGTIGNNNTNLSNGTYQAYVSDDNGCLDTLTYFILNPLPIVSVINTNDVSCVGGVDGSASVSSSGGTSPFTYLWSDGQIGSTATNLSESSYEVFVTDSANCLDTAYFSIGSNPINISISTTNVTCNGNDGIADVSVTGGAAPYTYVWYFEYPGFGYVTAYFQEDISNIPSGTYYVEVTDANGCTSNSDTITLVVDDVVINALVTDVSCNGGADGTIDITATGGLFPYTYAWSDGSITADIINITTGNNTITVTDANNCSITESYTINEPTPLIVSAISNPVTTACDGSIDVSVSGGAPAYSFAWQLPASAITDSFTVTTASTTSAHPYFSYSPFQVYEIDGVQGAELTLIRGETYYFTMDNVLFFHPFYLSTDMFGGQSGSFVGQVTTGVTNLDAVGTYSATNNQTIAFTPNSSHADTLYYQCGNHMYMGYRIIITDGITSEDLSGLCEGTYDLAVTDANGCSDNYSYIIGSTIYGCTDSTAINFDVMANTDNGSCIAYNYGCMDSTQFNYNILANTDDGSCISFVYGCIDSTATNYNVSANTDDGSCTFCYAVADIGADTITACDSVLISTNPITNGSYCWNNPSLSGVVAYYPFNSNANDESGNGNNGIVNGATLTTDRFGNLNSAYNFDGSDDYINIGTDPMLNRSNTDFSINVWVNTNTLSPWFSTIITNRNPNYQGSLFGIHQNQLGLTSGDPNNAYTNNISLSTDQWYNICVTHEDNSDLTNFYIDGTLIYSTTSFGYFPAPNPPTLHTIGAETQGNVNGLTGYVFDGEIDDMYLFNRVISVIEIQELYNVGSCTNYSNSITVSTSGWNYVTVTDSLGCTATDSVYVHIDVCACTDPTALNYNPSATFDDGSCIATVYGCIDATAFNYNASANTDDGSCIAIALGCIDTTAFNYNALANTDNGSCIAIAFGCIDATAFNYNALANTDDGSCTATVYGCIDATAFNYNALANTDDGSCIATVYGCLDATAFNYNALANTDDGSCIAIVYGCIDATAFNYDASANTDDNTCTYDVFGCTDSTALNFDPLANTDDGSCILVVLGCTDSTAANFNPLANTDDGSCSVCADNYVNIQIITANYGSEVAWELVDDAGGIVASGGCQSFPGTCYNSNTTYDNWLCIPTACYSLNLYDMFGDGWAGGTYAIYDANGTTYAYGTLSTGYSSTITDIGIPFCSVLGCTDPTATNYNALANTDDGSCYTIQCVEVLPYSDDLELGSSNNRITLTSGNNASSSVNGYAANVGNYGWHGEAINVWSGGTPSSGQNAFNTKPDNIATLNICVDLDAIVYNPSDVYHLKFDLKQEYSYNANYSWFRVQADNAAISDNNGNTYFQPNTPTSDSWQEITYDVTSYVSMGVFDFDFQTCNKYSYGSFNNGDNGYVDNILIYKVIYGCTDNTMYNYYTLANTDDGSCISFVYGCMDSSACNYDILANSDDNSCAYPTTSAASVTTCDSSYTWNGTTYTQSGTYSYNGNPSNYSLDVLGNGRVEVPNLTYLSYEFTISGSFKQSAYGGPVLTRYDGYSTGGSEWSIIIATTNSTVTCLVNGPEGNRQITGYKSVDDGNWHHFDITYLHDVNNPSSNNFSLYIDDVLESTTNNTAGPLFNNLNNTDFVTHLGGLGGASYDGNLDNIRIWDRVLSQQEIQDYTSCPPTGSEAGLLAYWNFEDNSNPNVALDVSGNGHNGTIVGLASYSADPAVSSCMLINQNGCDSTEILNLTLAICGCTDSTSLNYNSNATLDDGSCTNCYAVADIGADTIVACDSTIISTNPITNSSYIWNTSNTSTSVTLAIGDTYQGGIVFYLDGNGGGLIAAPSDQSTGAEWGCYGTAISGADGTAIGTGAQNTIDIEAGCTTTGIATDICANLTIGGYSDWFLPSKDELNQMYLQKGVIGGFANDWYWSSTELNGYNAWEQNFYNNAKYFSPKVYSNYVRAIRTFSIPINSDTTNSVMVSTSGWNYVTVTDSLGCTATDSVYINIQNCIYGCTDPSATNYDATATVDDGSCTFCYATADIGTDSITACDSTLISTNPIINGSYSWNTSNVSTSVTPAIGDFHQGGVVFWIDPNDNTQGLVCDIYELNTGGIAEWGCLGINISGANQLAIGTGEQNTIDIVNANCQPSLNTNTIAAELCYNSINGGYSDWYLASLDEMLSIMAIANSVIHPTSLIYGGDPISNLDYWTSSEDGVNSAYLVNSAGASGYFDKSLSYPNVRAVRNFSSPIVLTNSVMVLTSGWNYVTVTDSLGCTATDSVYVNIQNCIYGCTDPSATNYDASATTDDGSCTYSISGCTDPTATNYDASATSDDGSCTYVIACTKPVPTGLYIDGIIQVRAMIHWDNMSDANCMVLKYYIQSRPIGTTAWATKFIQDAGLCNQGISVHAKNITQLTPSTTYEYRMKAAYCNTSGQSAWTAISTFTTADDCPNVTNFTATPGPQTNRVIFSWDAPSAYEFVRIKLRVDSISSPTGSDWVQAGGFGVNYPQLSVSKWGVVPSETYRGQARTWCDPAAGLYRSESWTPLVFWTQPTSAKIEGGTVINNLTIYPNPSRDIFNISFTSEQIQDLKVRIMNVIGEELINESLEQFIGEYTKQVDLAAYTKGVYFLEITTNNGVVNKKLILQ